MKNLAKTSVLALAAFTFAFASCDSKKAENAENTVEGTIDDAAAELDSATTATEGDTAVLQNEPVQDGIVDSTATK